MTETAYKWRVRSRDQVADCRVFNVTKRNSVDENGREGTFYVIEAPDWINVIPVTKDGDIILIKQFRHGTEEFTLEIPGGMVDEGESAQETASRELTEETGFVAGKMVYLGSSRPNPAIQSNTLHHFAALDCVESGEQAFDEHESIAVRRVSSHELDALIESGDIDHSLVLAGLLKFREFASKERTYSYES
ncbi:MAG: NUDIX hydrolase [Acidobacteria bacterium]|nr:MAG: NUDIX hydrolase [Acidobacteriota bacterium]REK01768.1 MAG: NUDIX hydrolase [Acidobacteriota bacterium]REK14724.1 MAG: NUDIX hydrolase [Acidobacteriota bacterium]REK45439.1 MAG: NUDIX hydrolase [Acidobacteriota bacterium]